MPKTLLYLLVVFLLCSCFNTPLVSSENENQNIAMRWENVEKLEKEQKYKEAHKETLAILQTAQNEQNYSEWTKSLIHAATLQRALHGYEKAVVFLEEEKWPEDEFGQALLHLFFANSLNHYYSQYSWEINQREKVLSDKKIDLKKWTSQQIFKRIHQEYSQSYKQREALGKYFVKDFPKYFQRNGYPENIRATLRDLLVYSWAQFFSNTMTWTPAEEKEKYKVDFKNLLALPSTRSSVENTFFLQEDIHPLVRAIHLLDNLYAWHQEKRPESALETQLERIRRVLAVFYESKHLQAGQEALAILLKDYESYPWWSVGVLEEARLWQRQNDLVKARQSANKGYQIYPESLGGKKCLYLMRSIEAPSYSVSTMAIDKAQSRAIQVSHKNISKLYFRAYRADFEKLLNSWWVYYGRHEDSVLQEILAKQQPAYEWEVDIPDLKDYQMHKTYAQSPIKEKGFFAIFASAKKDFSKKENQIVSTCRIISDMVLLETQKQSRWEVMVVKGENGQPVPSAEITLYHNNYNRGTEEIDSIKADENGYAYLGKRYKNVFLVARKGDDFTLDHQNIYFGNHYPTSRYQQSSFIYTDRSIYRPLQKVFFKVVTYRGNSQKGDYKSMPYTPVKASFYDPNSKVIETLTLKTNSYGTTSGSFTIPTGRVLGNYYVQCSVKGNYSTSYFRVEEYKRPTFEVELEKPEKEIRLNQLSKIQGKAKYYFGMPVTEGKVSYRITRSPNYPWWYSWYYGPVGSSGEYEVAAGETKIDSKGNFYLNFTPKGDESVANKEAVSYNFRVEVDVTDTGGETRNASSYYQIGFVSVRAQFTMNESFFSANSAGEITVKREDLNSVGRKGEGSYQLIRLQNPQTVTLPSQFPLPQSEGKKYTPGDLQRPRWESPKSLSQHLFSFADGESLAKGQLLHNERGEAVINFSGLAAGAYRIRYQTKDSFGTEYQTQKEFYVAAQETPLTVPLFLQVQKQHHQVGQAVQIYLGSGLPQQTLWLEFYQNSELMERRQLKTPLSNHLIEYPLTEKHRGGFSVRLSTVHDYVHHRQEASVYVPWDNKHLELSFDTFRNLLRPGQEETWTISVKGPNAQAAAAEVLAYMYDRSLDFFAAHNPPNLSSLYPAKYGTSYLRHNLSSRSFSTIFSHNWYSLPSNPYFSPDTFRLFDGYPVGGPGGRGGRFHRFGNGEALMEMAEEDSAPVPTSSAPRRERAALKQEAKLAKKPAAKNGESEKEEASPLRTNFNETAFFQPHLSADKDGKVQIKFTVPDSVTEWKVYLHALTKDLKFMTLQKEVVTKKDLMVRPYMPRFLREGDEALLKVVINNASSKELSGDVFLEIIDPDSEEDKSADFGLKGKQLTWKASAEASATVSWKLQTPRKLGLYAFKVTAKSKNLSDGELRPITILPSRIHLSQSKFITLKDDQTRSMRIEDLAKAGEDETMIHNSLVVNLEGQLFYTVLKSLPYLVNYPYECVEQTLNRFLCTGMISSMYDQYPALTKMAAQFAERKTMWEGWQKNDANRQMALEETPWLSASKGGPNDEDTDLIKVLNPDIAKAHQEASLRKLKEAQLSNGGFPWWAGGPESPYMTLYMLSGFARAREFKVEIDPQMIRQAWQYVGGHIHEHYLDRPEKEWSYSFITWVNYLLSCYPQKDYQGAFSKEDRSKMLAFSFRNWTKHSPYLKGLLALTLHRDERSSDAKLVLESIMDSATTQEDQGTFWAEEDRTWLWYNDNIESHAFILRALLEIKPEDKKHIDGLVLWLLLNKKMNQWKSTRATAEVIYSLVKVMEAEGSLAVRETAEVKVGHQKHSFVFEPDEYTGNQNQIVVLGSKVNPKTMAEVEVSKTGKGYMFASMNWHYSTEKLPEEARGDFLRVTRHYFLRKHQGEEYVLLPLEEGNAIEIGDQVEVHLSIRSKHPMEYVQLRDPRAAGFEPENQVSRHHWRLGLAWYEEIRDSGANFFFEYLPQGEFNFTYRIRANMAGKFRVGPATLQGMYAPEFSAFSSGKVIEIK